MKFGSNEVSGAILNATAGENLVFGNVCYYKTSKYYKADASALTTVTTQLVMALETISQDAAGWFLVDGYVFDSGWSFNSGADVYLSETAGDSTETEPAISKIIGMGDDTVLYFNPSRDFGTIGLGEVLQIATKSGAYTLDGDDDVIIATGTFTIKTPASENTGKIYHIKNKGTGIITIDANDLGSTTIDDLATQLLAQYDGISFMYDSSEYWII